MHYSSADQFTLFIMTYYNGTYTKNLGNFKRQIQIKINTLIYYKTLIN